MNNYEFTIKLSGGIKIFNEIGMNSAEAFNKIKLRLRNVKVIQANFRKVSFITLD